jgi:UDP-glucose 4-epimerase
VSVRELVDAIAQAAGKTDVRPQLAAARAGKVHRSCLDVSLARAELGLPAPTPLVDVLSATLRWLQEAALSP